MNTLISNRFADIAYLASGSALQRRAYHTLCASRLMDILQPYDIMLVGTIPLDIAVATSDLDLICCAEDLDAFRMDVVAAAGGYAGFRMSEKWIKDEQTILANFYLGDFEVEVFGQSVPVKLQNGFLHMMKEYEILTKYGPDFKEKVIALKTKGLKTEPAFAMLLNIEGDPYEGLLNYTVNNEDF